MQFFTGRKHGQSLEALGHVFYSSVVKQSLQKQCKNFQKFTDQRVDGRTITRTLNTPLMTFTCAYDTIRFDTVVFKN